MDGKNVDLSSIHCLPDEIIIMVLRFNKIKEILRFSVTCKRFNGVIVNNQSLWKEKIKTSLPHVYGAAEKHCNGHWFQEIKQYEKQKEIIYKQLMKMSHKLYWKIEDVTLDDFSDFFTIASSHSRAYYYTIFILQDFIIKVNKKTSKFYTEKPFTMTELFYAKIALRHLIHCFLCVKWVKHQNELTFPPENVINYFLQWIDTQKLHNMEDVENKLQEITAKVKEYMLGNYPDQLRSNDHYTPEQIIHSITKVLFQENSISMISVATLDHIDMIKVWDKGIGNKIVVYAMYQAIAKRAGLSLDLIVFANHLFLQWKCFEDDKDYRINVLSGRLMPSRSCPFSQTIVAAPHCRYSADSLLQCLHSSYIKSCMVSPKQWTAVNATDLLGFLGGNYCHASPYDNFYSYLYQNVHFMSSISNLNLKNLTKTELECISSLVHVQRMAKQPSYTQGRVTGLRTKLRPLEVKKHDARVLYAVGLVCCHNVHEYMCVIRGWDCEFNMALRSSTAEGQLSNGFQQPFYKVIATDYSERYVAQECLVPLIMPIRLTDIEELLGKEFSYFDGFCYVLNEEKIREYPEESPIIDVFRQRCHKSI